MAIDLKDVLTTIKSGAWLSIRFFTADVLKGQGGKIIELAKCRIARRELMQRDDTLRENISGIKKEPMHNVHFTLNVELPNKQLRKIHPILITHLNNQTVL
jgi:hypothetical protein